jgi:hypothetical protein
MMRRFVSAVFWAVFIYSFLFGPSNSILSAADAPSLLTPQPSTPSPAATSAVSAVPVASAIPVASAVPAASAVPSAASKGPDNLNGNKTGGSGLTGAVPPLSAAPAAPESASPEAENMVEEVEPGPEQLAAQAQGMKVKLDWKEMPKSDGAVTYNIYRATAPDDDFIRVNRDAIKTNSFTDEKTTSIIPLQSAINYYYKVDAVINGSETGDSNIAQAMPSGVLEPPDNIVSAPGNMGVVLKWSAPESEGPNGVTGYNIYRATEGPMLKLNAAPLSAYEYDDAGLTNGAKYFYALQSVDTKGILSELSVPVFVVPFGNVSSPRNVTAQSVSSESIKVTWDAPQDKGTYGISGYNIYRSSVPGSFPDKPINMKIWPELKDEQNRLFFYDNIVNSREKPEPGINYLYKVQPVDPAGNTGAASEAAPAVISVIEIKQSGTLSQDISEYGLPPDSKLTLSGKKSLGLSYTYTWPDAASGLKQSSNFDIQQKLKLVLNGTIGKKIIVDVNYDEEMLTDEYTKISIKYEGEKEEALQEVSFGDMSLDLPSTRYVSYSQTLFGIKGKIKLGDKLTLTGIGAQTKGITDIQTFTGNLREMEVNGKKGVDIPDTAYTPNVYYYITKSLTEKIKPGSIVLYSSTNTVIGQNANTNALGYALLHPGIDYTVDYDAKVIKLNFSMLDSYSLVIGYQDVDGTNVGLAGSDVDFTKGLQSAPNGVTTSDAHMIQVGNGTGGSNQIDMSHRVMSYYYMGQTQIYNPLIDTGYFIIRIQSIDGSKIYDLPRPQDGNSSQYYSIDTTFGILKFVSPFPFAAAQTQPGSPTLPGIEDGTQADCYNLIPANKKSLYSIHLEYKYYVSSYKLDHFPVVYGSERVEVDGKLMKKDVDYYIFYDTGEVSFIDKTKIQATTDVRIVYEYFPFLQTFQSNLFGARLDYQVADNMSIGGTWLYKAASSGSTIPDARSTETALSTPYSSWVLDGNVNFSLNKDAMNNIINALPGVENASLPVDYKFSGEMAYSDYNINIFDRDLGNSHTEHGVAMIDNMEGADNTLSCAMSYKNWFPASSPYGVIPIPESTTQHTNRVYFDRSDVQDQSQEYQTSASLITTQQQVTDLNLNFSGLTQDKWEALRYILSSTGQSFKQYNYIEMWVYVNVNQPVNMSLELGVISEDSNGSGVFAYNQSPKSVIPADQAGGIVLNESEDYDQNGKYTIDNDLGISSGIYPNNPTYWGKGNQTLDTEDMNNNGRLDTSEAYYIYSRDNNNNQALTLSGSGQWVNIKIPLKNYTGILGGVIPDATNPNFMSNIQHLRVAFKGTSATPASGTIRIQSIKFTGNSWQLQYLPNAQDLAGNIINAPDSTKFNVVTINQNINPSYTPNLEFFDIQTDSDKKYETSLDLSYSLSNMDEYQGLPIYYATKFLNSTGSGYDYSQYKKMKMDVFFNKWDTNSPPGKVLFVRLGSSNDQTTNYYQYNQVVTQAMNNGWQTIEFMIDGSDDKRSLPVGIPVLREVQYVTIGVINPGSAQVSEEVYIDNIRLTDPTPKQGSAKYLSQVLNMEKVGSLTHTFEDRDSDFYTLADAGRADVKQHTASNRVDLSYNQIQAIPMSFSYNKAATYTDDKYANDPSYTNNGTLTDNYSESYSGNANFTLLPDLPISMLASIDNGNVVFRGTYDYESRKTRRITIKPTVTYKPPANLFFIPLGSNNFSASVYWEDDDSNYYVPTTDTVAESTYYSSWNTSRKQDYNWTGSYSLWNITFQPSFHYMLFEVKGNQTTTFPYYQPDVFGYKNYTRDFLLLTREMDPAFNLSMASAWIFAPQIGYTSKYSADYSSSQLTTSGSLWGQSAVNFSQLLPFLPNITTYKVSIDTTGLYSNLVYPGSIKAFDGLSFERRWGAVMWKYLYDENEISKIEDLSQNGTFVFAHNLTLSEINVLGKTGITPGATYSMNRTSSSQGSVRSFNEIISFSGSNFHIDNITIPLPLIQDFVTNQKIAGGYTYRRTVIRDSNRQVTNDTIQHSIDSLSLSFSQKDGISGSLMYASRWANTIQGNIDYYNNVYTPTLNLGYNYRQTTPITLPSWVPFVGDKTFKFDQVVNLNLVTTMNFTRGGDLNPDNKNEHRVDSTDFRMTLTASYNALQNLKISSNLAFYDISDKYIATNSYKSITLGISGEIEF